MSRLPKFIRVGALVLGGLLVVAQALAALWLDAPVALAGPTSSASASPGQNDGEGDISSDNGNTQSGSSSSGDAVAGQVVGVVSAGDASVDATNRSEGVDIETGDANGSNGLNQFVGQLSVGGGTNELESGAEISSEVSQAADATSGDGVGGQVIGVVTSAGGSADVVAANTSEDVDIETGDADANNFVGPTLCLLGPCNGVGQFAFDGGENDADDDISSELAQTASAASGDGVGGQVLGIVSAGDASVDATNESTDVDVETGDALADNFVDHTVGQDAFGVEAANFSDGEISSEIVQDASANSGDAVAGQVAGVVTSAGGSADLVLANTSEDVDAESGLSEFDNEVEEFVGQQIEGEVDPG